MEGRKYLRYWEGMMSNLNDFTIILLIIHILGDFQLQTDKLTERKLEDKTALYIHIGIHGILLFILWIVCIFSSLIFEGLIIGILILLSHYILDRIKIYLTKNTRIKESILYIFDQISHILIILVLSEIVFEGKLNTFTLTYIPRDILLWVLVILLITKPTNVTFKILFSKYQLKENINDKTVEGAGAIIGNLERILSVIFIETGNINSIALVYTAKSIARFKQIEENKSFAEYYLIGTLFSILSSILIFYVIFKL